LNGRRRVGVAAVVDRSHVCLAVRRLVWYRWTETVSTVGRPSTERRCSIVGSNVQGNLVFTDGTTCRPCPSCGVTCDGAVALLGAAV